MEKTGDLLIFAPSVIIFLKQSNIFNIYVDFS